jgi:hypothetical protein
MEREIRMEKARKDRDIMFKQIFDVYNKGDEKEEKKRGNVLKDTSKGFYVPSDMKKVYEFFKKIKLEKYKSFVDLGSGDGRIALIASLFTKSSGIEVDDALYDKSIAIKDKLKLECNLVKGDFMDFDISQYDAVYMYPDKVFSKKMNEKLKKELKGDLLLFSDTFLPEALETREIDIDWMKFCICRPSKSHKTI